MSDSSSSRLLQSIVEPRRKQLSLSLRRAADRARMSEASWRQLVLGGVHVSGRWVAREARRPQLLAMAAALDEETLTSMAQRLEATDEEVASARSRVRVLDGAEEDILRSRHLAPSEKLHLLEALRALRQPPGGAQRAELG